MFLSLLPDGAFPRVGVICSPLYHQCSTEQVLNRWCCIENHCALLRESTQREDRRKRLPIGKKKSSHQSQSSALKGNRRTSTVQKSGDEMGVSWKPTERNNEGCRRMRTRKTSLDLLMGWPLITLEDQIELCRQAPSCKGRVSGR